MILGPLQLVEIDHGHKDERLGALFDDAGVQLAVHFEVERRLAVGAFGLDGKRERLSSQLPLQQGRRNGAGRSSGAHGFAAAQGDVVGRAVDRKSTRLNSSHYS